MVCLELRRYSDLYRGKFYTFYNVKLPLDGYLFSEDHTVDIRNDRSSDSRNFLETLKQVMTPSAVILNKGGWFYNYDYRKLEVRFIDANIIYHIGYEYGTPTDKI